MTDTEIKINNKHRGVMMMMTMMMMMWPDRVGARVQFLAKRERAHELFMSG